MNEKKLKKALRVAAWIMGLVVIGIAIYGLITSLS